MELNVQDWKEFRLNKVFTLKGGFFNKKPEHSEVGTIPFLASTENNNGVTEYYSINDLVNWDKVGEPDNTIENKLFSGNCIAVTVNGSVCNAFYQKTQFTCSHDITQLCLRHRAMNEYIGQFLCTIIMMEKYRWSYGRKPHDVKKFGQSKIKLPIKYNKDKTPVIDSNKVYSDEGYIPDWQFMENYIKTLRHKPITTKIKTNVVPELNVQNWKEFKVSRTEKQPGLLRMESCKCGCAGDLDDGNEICYIGAKKNDNGVMKHVKFDKKLVSSGNGIMIICDGQGSVGYSNYMKDDFIGSTTTSIGYDDEINSKRAIFIVTCLDLDRYKYSYGRKYRASMDSATVKLPVKRDSEGIIIKDKNKKYSNEGYIPDWQFMEDYINSLPYSDRI